MMVMSFFFACAVVLTLMSALWFRITRRDLEKSRAQALRVHLDWHPVVKSKAKNRTAYRR